jgi:hypothetical protein
MRPRSLGSADAEGSAARLAQLPYGRGSEGNAAATSASGPRGSRGPPTSTRKTARPASERRQVCWSHLRRDFTFHADLGLGAQETFGLDGLEVAWNVFQAWKQFQRDGDRTALKRRVAEIKQQMQPLLEWGSTGKRQRHVRALAKNLLKLWPALWTFADVPDVEPTNNAAERGLRAAVIDRKLSLGSRSQGGERTIERLLSVDQTCRLQRRSLYAYSATSSPPKHAAIPSPA